MKQQARERGGELRATANAYMSAAEKLDAHAREVERLIELIAAIERKVTGLIAAAADRVADAARAVVDGAVDLVTGGDADDQRLAGAPTPPSGHKDWLDVPDSLGVRI
jgi:cell division septum initiation protein DivIVA